MSPSQKTSVIEIAQRQLGLRVMAIGDGYNDTQMLEAADCGIRIKKSQPVTGVSTATAAANRNLGQAQGLTNSGSSAAHIELDGVAASAKKAVQAEADFVITNFSQVQQLLFAHAYHS